VPPTEAAVEAPSSAEIGSASCTDGIKSAETADFCRAMSAETADFLQHGYGRHAASAETAEVSERRQPNFQVCDG
jgi:predicted HAD superfamily Cof-like phosphohydrolase